MGYKNREIEAKLLISNKVLTFQKTKNIVEKFMDEVYPDHKIIKGHSADIYWKAPKYGEAAFCRLRKNPHGRHQITIKGNDKGDNLDRVEIDLEVDDHDQAKILLTGLLGSPLESVSKRYEVFFFEDDHTNISVYSVTGDESGAVFVEVEAKTLERLKKIILDLSQFGELEFQRVGSSIYDMYVQKKKPKLLNLNDLTGEKSA